MPTLNEGDEPVKVPLVYYDEHGERHEIGAAAVQIRNGEVIAVGKIERDIVSEKFLGEINLETFSISGGPYQPTPADVAARRLGPLGIENREHVTATNPNGEIRQCDRRDLHAPHEYQAEFGAYFNVYCPGNRGEKR